MAELPACDVAVVGAGIAGSALALALAGSGLSVVLLEARPIDLSSSDPLPGLAGYDGRVSALTPHSLAFLDRLGAGEGIRRRRFCPYQSMQVWDAEGTGSITFDREEAGVPSLGSIVENRVIVEALLEALLAGGSARLRAPATLAAIRELGDDALDLRLDGGDRLRARLLVAADGALSPVRGLLGFRTREWDYGQHALVATVRCERGHGAVARQRFLPCGPLAFLPLPGDGTCCSIVWSLDDAEVDGVMALEDRDFAEALAAAGEHCLGEVLEVSPRAVFPLRQRHALDYVQHRVALVGDAAHTIHPLAGQGINLGLRDVEALAAELRRALRRGEDPGDELLLRRYQRQRKGDNLVMMAAMDGFLRLFGSRAPTRRLLRNEGLRRVDRSGPIKRRLMREAMGLTA